MEKIVVHILVEVVANIGQWGKIGNLPLKGRIVILMVV